MKGDCAVIIGQICFLTSDLFKRPKRARGRLPRASMASNPPPGTGSSHHARPVSDAVPSKRLRAAVAAEISSAPPASLLSGQRTTGVAVPAAAAAVVPQLPPTTDGVALLPPAGARAQASGGAALTGGAQILAQVLPSVASPPFAPVPMALQLTLPAASYPCVANPGMVMRVQGPHGPFDIEVGRGQFFPPGGVFQVTPPTPAVAPAVAPAVHQQAAFDAPLMIGGGEVPDMGKPCPFCKKDTTRLQWYHKKYGYPKAAPPYCFRCMDNFRKHMIKQSRISCTRAKPCAGCCAILVHMPKFHANRQAFWNVLDEMPDNFVPNGGADRGGLGSGSVVFALGAAADAAGAGAAAAVSAPCPVSGMSGGHYHAQHAQLLPQGQLPAVAPAAAAGVGGATRVLSRSATLSPLLTKRKQARVLDAK